MMMMMTTAFTNQQDSQMSCTEYNVTHLMQIFPPNLKLEAPTESTITGVILLHLLNGENKKQRQEGKSSFRAEHKGSDGVSVFS